MPHTVLSSVAGLDFVSREIHPVALFVIGYDRSHEFVGIPKRIFPIVLVRSGIRKGLFDMGRRFKIGRADAQIVDFLSGFLEFNPPVIQCGKNFFSETVDGSGKLHDFSSFTSNEWATVSVLSH